MHSATYLRIWEDMLASYACSTTTRHKREKVMKDAKHRSKR